MVAWGQLFGVASRSIAVRALPAVAIALVNRMPHVVPVSMHDMGSMVESVTEMHDYCKRRMEKEPVRYASPFCYDNLPLFWKTHLLKCSSDG